MVDQPEVSQPPKVVPTATLPPPAENPSPLKKAATAAVEMATQGIRKAVDAVKQPKTEREVQPNQDLLQFSDMVLSRMENRERPAKFQNAVLPLAGAISARFAADRATDILNLTASASPPLFGGIMSGFATYTSLAVERVLGKNVWQKFAQYSHVEGGKGFRGKVRKVLQLFFREPEKLLYEKMLRIKGSKEVDELVALADKQDANLSELNPEKVEQLIREGQWYRTGVKAAQVLGANLSEKDIKKIRLSLPKVEQMMDKILSTHFPNADEKLEFIREINQALQKRERRVWRKGAIASAGFGAIRASLLTPIFTRIGQWFSGLPMYHFGEAGKHLGAAYTTAKEQAIQLGGEAGETITGVYETTAQNIANLRDHITAATAPSEPLGIAGGKISEAARNVGSFVNTQADALGESINQATDSIAKSGELGQAAKETYEGVKALGQKAFEDITKGTPTVAPFTSPPIPETLETLTSSQATSQTLNEINEGINAAAQTIAPKAFTSPPIPETLP